jgi:hypothetical protein
MGPTALAVFTVFLGFCGTLDVLRQPGKAFRASGHRKLIWIAIEILGFIPFVALVTLPLYGVWPRRAVVRSGGYRRPRLRGRSHTTGWCVTCGGINSINCPTCYGAGRY